MNKEWFLITLHSISWSFDVINKMFFFYCQVLDKTDADCKKLGYNNCKNIKGEKGNNGTRGGNGGNAGVSG